MANQFGDRAGGHIPTACSARRTVDPMCDYAFLSSIGVRPAHPFWFCETFPGWSLPTSGAKFARLRLFRNCYSEQESRPIVPRPSAGQSSGHALICQRLS